MSSPWAPPHRFQNRREAYERPPSCDDCRRLDPRDLDRQPPPLTEHARVTIGTPSVVSRATGCPVADVENAFWIECTLEPRTPFSPEEPPPRASARVRASYLASVAIVRRSLRSPERRDARCVGPTSAFSRSSYEHSCLVGSRLSRDACAPSANPGIPPAFTAERFASAGYSVSTLGVLLPNARR
jgi:hypothetical protein